MRYWYDFEFVDDGRTIDVISLGIVAEDGREYYAQNTDCRFRRANAWVRAHVFPHLRYFDLRKLRPDLSLYGPPAAWSLWRSHQQIAEDVRAFCDPERYGTPELWGDYAAYDHVALAQLFGPMVNLPAGWPMYTNDVQQWARELGVTDFPPQEEGVEHNALDDARYIRQKWNHLVNCVSLSAMR